MQYECPKHPGAYAGRWGDQCTWCSGQIPHVRGSFMHREDRESLTEQLGVPVGDRSDFDRVKRENPQIAVVESNSEAAQARKALRDWSRQDPSRRGPPPAECLPKKTENPVNPLDAHKILARIRKQKSDERRKQAAE